MKLVIVESPTKAKTISRFLGRDYRVESSYGHVRDLPRSKLGIDIERGFAPQYVIPRKSQPRVTALKKAATGSDGVVLATDEDREGEAIAWHLAEVLGLEARNMKHETKKSEQVSSSPPEADPPLAGKFQVPRIERIVFHEITKSAIAEALKNPRGIDMSLVDAQQARRVLDRLVGYKLSPFLWRKVTRGLSAGRVQSVALRLIVEREKEIENFTPQEYWTITALLRSKGGEFEASLFKVNGEPIPGLGIPTEREAKRIAAELKQSDCAVAKAEKREVRKNPFPPFMTSTLQQAAANRLGFSAKKTMYLAQGLYENGLITYMRTDSVHLSKEALASAGKWIEKNLGARYALEEPRTFTNKSRLAQEAHEAIRPTKTESVPEKMKLEKDQKKLYDLIWRRFLASQLPSAVFDATRIEIEAKNSPNHIPYALLANGNILRFDGFLKMWPSKFEEKELPQLAEGDSLLLREVKPGQHFTEPPPRYSEASLVKTLEKNGIGRPSTYAPIISVIQERNYVEKMGGRFRPTEMGTLVSGVLTEHFPEIVNVQFTAKMEEELDEIAERKKKWQNVIREFYDPFTKHLEKKYEVVSREKIVSETTDEKCEKCGKPMVIKFGRFGKFMACSGFPECKNTKTLKEPPKSTGLKCPTCGTGELLERRVRNGRARGRIFWGCSRYPECDYASWTDPRKTNEARSPGEK